MQSSSGVCRHMSHHESIFDICSLETKAKCLSYSNQDRCAEWINRFAVSVYIRKQFLALLICMFYTASALAVDIQVSRLEDTPDPAVRGGVITYEIDVQNNAGDTANDVELEFPLPANTMFDLVDNAACSHDGGNPGT